MVDGAARGSVSTSHAIAILGTPLLMLNQDNAFFHHPPEGCATHARATWSAVHGVQVRSEAYHGL